MFVSKPFYGVMENDVKLELLEPALYHIYVQIGTKAYNQHYTHLWPYGNTLTYIQHSFTQEVLLKEEQDPNTKLYLIKNNQEYVGILKITVDKQLAEYNSSEALYLDKIYILKEHSKKGIGSKCIEFVEDYAKKLSKKAVFLESMQKGSALPFYISKSFFIVAKTSVPFENVIEEEKPMYLLMKKI